MSSVREVIVILLVFSMEKMLAFKPEYYWRDYFGEIPYDAILAGTDVTGRNYIGQSLVKTNQYNSGVVVVEIRPDQTRFLVEFSGPKTIDKNIKILCGRQVNFKWFLVDGNSLKTELIGKHAVFGGHQTANGGIYYIGRINVGGELKIAYVESFRKDGRMPYRDGNNKAAFAHHYQVLVNVVVVKDPKNDTYPFNFDSDWLID